MQNVKIYAKNFFDFLKDKTLKTKFIRLCTLLFFLFLTFFNKNFGYVAFGLSAIYVAFEFSADSIFWLCLMGVMVGHTRSWCVQILIYELIIILLIHLIKDIINKKFDYKNWRFITLISLFFGFCLLTLLPLSQTYSFIASLKPISFVAVLILGVLYIKQINIKHFLMLFPISIILICILFVLAGYCGGRNTVFATKYSQGFVYRFSLFNHDPNFTGAIVICAIMSLFILYKKNKINNFMYFILLGLLGYFALTTISKATILIIGLFGLYVIIENIVITIKSKNPKHLLELVWYFIVLLCACCAGWKYVDAMYQRLVHPQNGWWDNSTNMSVENLTTGRWNLWKGYLNVIFSSWQIALFGSGVNSGQAGQGAYAHSMPIEYLYKFGIIGVILLLSIFIISILPYIKKAKIYNYVPLVLLTGMFCSLGTISVKYIYLFSIIFLTFCYNTNS